MGDLGTSGHGEADVGFPKGGSVIGSITSNGNDVAELFETGDDDVLVVGSGSGQDFELVSDDLHVG